jgi:hypothetical protein
VCIYLSNTIIVVLDRYRHSNSCVRQVYTLQSSWVIFIFITVPLCVALWEGKRHIYDYEMCVCEQCTGFQFTSLKNLRVINKWIMHLLDGDKKLNSKCIRWILNRYHYYGKQFWYSTELQCNYIFKTNRGKLTSYLHNRKL